MSPVRIPEGCSVTFFCSVMPHTFFFKNFSGGVYYFKQPHEHYIFLFPMMILVFMHVFSFVSRRSEDLLQNVFSSISSDAHTLDATSIKTDHSTSDWAIRIDLDNDSWRKLAQLLQVLVLPVRVIVWRNISLSPRSSTPHINQSQTKRPKMPCWVGNVKSAACKICNTPALSQLLEATIFKTGQFLSTALISLTKSKCYCFHRDIWTGTNCYIGPMSFVVLILSWINAIAANAAF